MGQTLTHKIIAAHLLEGDMTPGSDIALKVDQCLIQDATGTMVWLQFEQLGIPRVIPRRVVQYVDHNMIQDSFQNPDDHLFLQTMCARYGAVYSRPGNGISHFAHLERFEVPGDLMIGADSHTCAAGAMAMLAVGTGGMEVAAAMAGEPFWVKMPTVVRVNLVGEFPAWVSAKDLILEMLRRLTVKGGLNRVFEMVGPALDRITVYERMTVANMGQELGATSTVFPSDEMTRRFLRSQQREADWKPMAADPDAVYDETMEIDLRGLEPLIARPHSPDNVVTVRELAEAGVDVKQVAVGSSVNSSYRDLKMVAEIMKGKVVAPSLHMTLSPGSRQILINLEQEGAMFDMALAGVRGLEVACGPCIGMGAAPPSRGASIRTFNRNFPGRSGTPNDEVYLCSPETAAATALTGRVTDPRTLGRPPVVKERDEYLIYTQGFIDPPENGSQVEIYFGPNIKPVLLPAPPPDEVKGEVMLKLGDNISTDTILPGGARVLPLRSNIPAISEFTFAYVDRTFPARARELQAEGRVGVIVGGENYGQGSSREHAAIVSVFLGVNVVMVKSFARIHRSNLINWGVLPVLFADPADYDRLDRGDKLELRGIHAFVRGHAPLRVRNLSRDSEIPVFHDMSAREIEILLAGGLLQRIKTIRAASA
jgi:aconitate hydratase